MKERRSVRQRTFDILIHCVGEVNSISAEELIKKVYGKSVLNQPKWGIYEQWLKVKKAISKIRKEGEIYIVCRKVQLKRGCMYYYYIPKPGEANDYLEMMDKIENGIRISKQRCKKFIRGSKIEAVIRVPRRRSVNR